MSTYVVKQGSAYVAFPSTHCIHGNDDEWTNEQQYAWRWVGLDSGNGARLTARRIGARVVRLVPKRATELPGDGDRS